MSTNFTWDPTNGYTIGHMHNHPQDSPPSPADVIRGVNLAQMESMPTITSAEVDFYTKNFSAVVVTEDYVYTVTIKDAAQYKTMQANFDADQANSSHIAYANSYQISNPTASITEAQEYALLKQYGNAINLTRQTVSTTHNNRELKLGSNNRVSSNQPCP